MALLEGLERYLAKQPGVCNVKVKYSEPAPSVALDTWERATGCTLPSDAKSFFTSHDGLSMSWQYSYQESMIDVGCIQVASLANLLIINPDTSAGSGQPSFLDVCEFRENGKLSQKLASDFKIVVFESPPCVGQMCFLYKITQSSLPVFDGIWLIDLSLTLHRVCSTLSDYLRLAIVHLGLLQWQNLLTPNQLSPRILVWYELLLPKRLELDLYGEVDEEADQVVSSKLEVMKFRV